MHRKKKKAKRAKLVSKSVSSGVGGYSTAVASSSIAIQVFDNVYCVFFFFYVNYNSHIVTVSVTICNCIIDLYLYLCFIVMLIQ